MKKYGERIPLDTAKEFLKNEAEVWALIYRSSGIFLGAAMQADLTGIFDETAYGMDSALEARFFTDEWELHLFRLDGAVKAVLTKFSGADYLDVPYRLDSLYLNYTGGRTRLIVRQLLDTDEEDGQTVIRQTCLAGVEV